jgi:CheY-like chemotaxis protein
MRDSRLRHVPEYRGTETLLIVDDDDTFRELLVLALGTYGYSTLDAPNAEKALARMEGNAGPIDLLLTDFMMPKVGGADVAAMVRGRYPAVRVLFMSGYARGETFARGRLDDATGFIEKPFPVNQLAAAIRSLLDAQEERR